MATPRQPRRPIRRVAPLPATRGNVALSDPVLALNPYSTGANIYPNGGSNTSNPQGFRSPNPPVEQVSPTKPPLANIGATGTSFFGGIIQSDEYNPEFGWRDAVIKYEQMSRNEAQIMAIKQQVELPMLSADWKIAPASDSAIDQEIASFVQSCLFDDMCYTSESGVAVYQSWQETLRQILMYKWFGFMLLELCYRVEDGFVKWSRWLPLLPRTVWRWYVSEDNELESVEQWAYKAWTYQYNRIPRSKLLHFANRQEGQNYQGISVLRSAFKNWWYKQQFEKIAAIEIERNAIIPPVIQMGPNPSADEVNAALKLAQNIRANEQLGVVIGHDMHFEYPRMTERGAAQILPLIEYHDTMIARNILGQFINLGSHEVGSYALAQQQYTNFLNTLQADCTYVCDIINHQAIRQLVDYNYDGVAVYPKLTCSRLVAQDITTLSTALQYLNTYVPPSPEVNDAIADALGLPKPPASMVESTNPGAPTTPERPENERAGDHSDDDGHMAQGQVSGSGGGRDQSGDYQDTYDNGGAGDGVGMSESASLREFRLLRESLDAFHAQLDGEDAVERGLTYLFAGGGGNPNHIPKGEPGAGQFAPGGNGGHGGSGSGEHEGSGRGRGGAGGGASGGSEHEGHSRSGGARSRGSSKAAKETIHEKSVRLQHEHGLKAEAKPGRGKELIPNKLAPHEVRDINPAAHPDAHFLVKLYGEHQLGAALHSYSKARVEETAHQLGIKPGRTHDETVSRITAHVTQGRYSANFPREAKPAKASKSNATRGSKAPKEPTAKTAKTPEQQQKAIERQRATVERLRVEREQAHAALQHAMIHRPDDASPIIRSAQAEHAHELAKARLAKMEGEHEATTHATHAPKSSSRAKATKSEGERTLEQHTHDELKAMAREQGVKAGKTKAETIANLRAKQTEHTRAAADVREYIAARRTQNALHTQMQAFERRYDELRSQMQYKPTSKAGKAHNAKIERQLEAHIQQHLPLTQESGRVSGIINAFRQKYYGDALFGRSRRDRYKQKVANQ